MVVIDSSDALARALTLPLDLQIASLLLERLRQLGEDFGEHCRFVVFQPGDHPCWMEQALGFSIYENAGDGTRYGDAGYSPGFELAVLEPGDTAGDVERETGVNPLVSPLDGTRYGDTGFEQYCDWLSFSDGHFEWITCAGDTGYATILLVPDRPDVDAELIAMLHEYAGEAGRG